MLKIQKVITKREQREFLNFPLRLYKDCPYFVPPLYADEKKIFRKDYVYYDTSEAVYFLAERDGKTVGRISGILQKAANEKTGEKRIRFTRLDAIDDREVFAALFEAVEAWAKEKGMNRICGPLGFSDLEREGLLIEGFDQVCTFEEQYNYDYYQKHIEALGYRKEVDWVESQIRLPEKKDAKLPWLSDKVMERYHLHWGEAKNISEFIDKYADDMFHLLDVSYDQLYGTVPFTNNMTKMMIENFRLIARVRYVGVLLTDKDEMVGFGICFPSLSKALQKSDGHLTPGALIRILHAIRKPEILDFGLVGVDPKFLNSGITACIIYKLQELMEKEHIEHAETNLNLEDNSSIRTMWKRFNATENKRRRSYVKDI